MPSYEFLNIAKTGGVAPAPARPSIKVEIEAPTVLGFAVELVGAQSGPLLGRFSLAEGRLSVERDAREAYGRQHIARDEDVKKEVFQDVLVLRVVVIGQLGQKLDVEGSIHINRDAGLVLQVLPPARRARLAEVERVGVLSLDPGPKSLPTLALGVVALAVELFVNRPYQVHDVRGHALVRREIGQVVRQVVLHYCSNCLRGAPKPNTP